ncbi:MAG: glycosyltransferase, partial [Acidimicrobiales bacterium]
LAARAVGIPHLTFAHEFGVDDHSLTFFLGFERSLRLLSRLSAAFVANSQATADFFTGQLARPVPVMPYPMTLAPRRLHPLGPRGDHLRCLVLGRVTDGKNQLAAVRAVGQARAAGIPVTLRVVGTGDAACLARVLAEVDARGLAGAVRHQAHVADPAAEIDAAHVLVVPSRREAFGRVTVEAMLRSRPVIAAASGASPELVQPGRSGLLYDPDDPGALAAALGTAWHDWDGLRRWSAEAYATATTAFSETRTLTAFEAAVAHL